MSADKNDSPTSTDWFRISLVAIALAYAFLAGLRTVADFDLGWQLATGRYILQHHLIPSTEVFSYTAHGNPWLYPPFSGVIFYLLYLAGGYAALSWLSAVACCATVAILAGQEQEPARPSLSLPSRQSLFARFRARSFSRRSFSPPSQQSSGIIIKATRRACSCCRC